MKRIDRKSHPGWLTARALHLTSLYATLSFAAVACVACSAGDPKPAGEPDDPGVAKVISALTAPGVDYAWSRPSSPQALRAAGYTFVSRYLSWDTSGKNLTASEAQSLFAAGIDVVANWEYGATDALQGYSTGQSDAQEAQTLAAGCGMPPDRPIYFSVDFDATPQQQAAIDSYFDGVAAVIGVARAGAYGDYYVIQRLFDHGKITWGWQTYAWSGGQWEPRAQLQQIQNGVTVAGASCDIDQAAAADFGQWGPGGVGFWADGSSGTRCGSSPMTVGAIDAKYRALGGCSSALGAPTTEERATPDGVGRYSVFEHGSIYWTANTGAFEVLGAIRDKWRDMGWEGGVLGYPTTDETLAPDGVGRYNHFQDGSIYWTPSTSAFEIHGPIYDAWAQSGWETGPLGYPVSDVYAVPGGFRTDFQFGSILSNTATGQTTIDLDADAGGTGGDGGARGTVGTDAGGTGAGGAGGTSSTGDRGGTLGVGGTVAGTGGASARTAMDAGTPVPPSAERAGLGAPGCHVASSREPSRLALVLLGLPMLFRRWRRGHHRKR